MNLSQLKPPRGQSIRTQRIGQGMGSGRRKNSRAAARRRQVHFGLFADARIEGADAAASPLPKRGLPTFSGKEYRS